MDAISQKEYWEKAKKRRSPDHPVIQAFAMPKIQYIRDYVNLSNNTKVLDVGCGNGFFTHHFANLAYTVGIDYSRHMLSTNPCNSLVLGSALSLPFRNGSFDLVFCSNLLHHVKNPEAAIKEMRRVSKNYVVLSEPNRSNLLMAIFSLIIPEERGALKFSLNYLKKLTTSCGLGIIDSCSLGAVVPNKTPLLLLGLLKILDSRTPFGFYNIVVARKQNKTEKLLT